MEDKLKLSNSASDSRKMPKQITAAMIPKGEDLKTVRERQSLIRQFYSWWAYHHPENKVHNKALDEDIRVSYNSRQETSRQAAYRYQSTLAVLKLDYILANALPILFDKADPNTKAQKKFERMLLMKCECQNTGTVKLTVGVYRTSKQKEQYCITVIETDFAEAFKRSKLHNPKKASKIKNTNRLKKPAR